MEGLRRVAITLAFLGAALAAALVGLSVGSSRAAGGDEVDLTRLPIGDGKVSTTAARRGWIYACQLTSGGPGAFADGPWIKSDGTFDLTAKPTVDGSVEWPVARVRISRSRGRGRVNVTGNGLPVDHTTGNFPIAPDDDAYQYDRNPNSIRSQSVSLTLPRARRASRASCLSLGPVGYATNGVAIFNGLDARNRDAVAHEIQDGCGGHPQQSGAYHYHSGSACLTGSGRRAKVVGWMLDGYPLVYERGVTNSDLDGCHGRTSTVSIFGRRTRTYHYNVTAEYPYTIGCYRGTPLRRTGAP